MIFVGIANCVLNGYISEIIIIDALKLSCLFVYFIMILNTGYSDTCLYLQMQRG